MAATTISVGQGTNIYIRQLNSISYSTDQSNWYGIIFPCTIVNNTLNSTTFVKVLFDDINIDSDTQYFICGSNYIQFGSKTLNPNGRRPVINVSTNYGGLINNVNRKNFIYIFNLFVNGIVNGTITQTTAGWITRQDFGGNNIKIINCSSNGDIQPYGGGIVAKTGFFTGEIIGCSSSGEIIRDGGGIIGFTDINNNNNFVISFCFSSGKIKSGSCGISRSSKSSLTINNCYSTGDIVNNSVGIGGALDINCTINNCYTTGSITASGAGINRGNIDSISSVYNNNCYTTGSIGSNTELGGGVSLFKTRMTNVYVAGQLNNSIRTGFFIRNDASVDFPNCYSEAYNNNTGWNDINAKSVLTGVATTDVPSDTDIWVSSNNNTPFHFAYMGYTPYSTEIINDNNELVRTFSSSIKRGKKTNPALINSRSYTILGISGGDYNSYGFISINNSTGEISTTSSTFPGTYTIYISSKDETETTFYYTKYILTVDTVTVNLTSNFLDFSNNFSPSVNYPCRYNLLKSTYFLNFLDINGNLIIRNGVLGLTNGDISGDFDLYHYYGNYNDKNIKHSLYDNTNKLIFNGVPDTSNNIYFYNNTSFQNNKTGGNNIALGYNSLMQNTTGSFNIGIGYNSGNNIVFQNYNTCIGSNTGIDVSTNNYNSSTAIGYNAKITGNNLVVLGTPNENLYIPGSLSVNAPIDVCGNIISSNITNSFTCVSGQIQFSSNSNIIFNSVVQSTTYENIRVNNNGYIGVNNSNPIYNFDVNGTSLFSNGTKYANGVSYQDKITRGTTGTTGTFILSPIMDGNNIYSGKYNDGSFNIGIGMGALNTLNSMSTINYGSCNTSMGKNSLYSCTTGSDNTALGSYSLYSCTTGYNNSAMGYQALYSCTTGYNNSAMGYQSLYSCTTGYNNSAMGYQALYSCTTGYNNSAMGYQALYSCTTGHNNSAMGYQSLYSCTIGNYNSAMGYQSLYSCTGNDNSAMGYQSLYSCTTGHNNSAMGDQSLYSCTTGDNNSAIGHNALYSCTTGDNNSAIGHNALYSCTNGINNSAIGSYSGFSLQSGIQNVFIGYNSAKKTTIGGNNVTIGTNSFFNNIDSSNAIAIGGNSLLDATVTNIAIGYNSGNNVISQSNNIFIGFNTGLDKNTSTWGNSVALGNYARITSSNQVVLGGPEGNVYIPGTLWVNGACNVYKTYTISDKRVKENIVPLDETYLVDNLKPVIYENVLSNGKELGFLAHEIQEQYPFLVEGKKDGNTYQCVNYNGLIPISVNELKILKKEQKKILEELKMQIQIIKEIKNQQKI